MQTQIVKSMEHEMETTTYQNEKAEALDSSFHFILHVVSHLILHLGGYPYLNPKHM